MNAVQLLDHFERIAEAPDAVPRLRRFILDLAVRGKLVEQDPNDEPALELLRRIQSEKTRLIEHGQLKRAATRPAGDLVEGPFGLPSTWAWGCLGDVARYGLPDKVDSNNDIATDTWVLDLEDVQRDTSRLIERVLSSARPFRSTKTIFKRGDVLFGKLRPYLNKVLVADQDGVCTTEIIAIRGYCGVVPEYVRLVLKSPLTMAQIDRLMYGMKMPRLGTEDAVGLHFPLPPITEQRRIVAKVDELMALCDRLAEAQAERESRRDRLVAASLNRLNNGADAESFREHARFHLRHLPRLTTRAEHIQQLRQTILNLAVRGKLVQQNANDDSALKLIARIQTERAQRKKNGNLGREPQLPTVNKANAPFALPPGWVWARFPELGTFGRGKSKHRPRNDPSLFDQGTHLLVQTGDVARSNGVIQTFTGKYNEVGLAQSAKWPKGTLCITIAANIADSGILAFDACFPDSVVGFIPALLFPNARFFEYFVRTAKGKLLEFAPATAQKNINLAILNEVLVPLPPLAEQIRIVAKVDELMALCDEVEAQLATTTFTGRAFLNATLDRAISSGSYTSLTRNKEMQP